MSKLAGLRDMLARTEDFTTAKAAIESMEPRVIGKLGSLGENENLSKEDLVRALRCMIVAEFDAINLYQKLSESTDNPMVKRIMTEVANDERRHVGSFLKMLVEVEPSEEQFYQDGIVEADKLIKES